MPDIERDTERNIERIEAIRNKLTNLAEDRSGYFRSNGTPTDATYDIKFLLEQLDKTTMALERCGSCPRCDERDQQEAEADDGMRNAAEMAGLQ